MSRAHRSPSRRARRAVALGLLPCALLAGCVVLPSTEEAAAGPVAPEEEPATETAAAVSVEELGAGERGEAVEVDVDGPVTMTYRRITIPPGAGTGLHCHHGQLLAIVEQGELTHHAPVYPGGVHVYSAGDSLVEGAGYVHEGVNEGDEDVVLLVTYVIEEGMPLAQTDLALCDG